MKSPIERIYQKRPPESHKGDFGKLLVVGGSKEYTGAPLLAGLAALKSGCDMVSVFAPKRAADIAATNPNLITRLAKGSHLGKQDFKEIETLSKRFDALVFGNGLGEKSQGLCEKMWKIKKPCVVDGDALKSIEGRLSQNFVLTPHQGEFTIITGKPVPKAIGKRKDLVKKTANKLDCTILLKGNVDIISDGRQVCENHTGNQYMTKAGTGDVLAGICGALLARKTMPFKAACAAAFISGSAGDLAAKEFGESLLATDVIDKIKEVVNIWK